MSAILKVYSILDTLASEKQGFYAVLKFMTILYELSLFEEESRTLSSSSFAKIDVHADSRRVQKVQEYINVHYKEEIRLSYLAEMALAWVLKDDLVTSVIIGASSVAQLEDNLKAIRNTSFTKEELRRL